MMKMNVRQNKGLGLILFVFLLLTVSNKVTGQQCGIKPTIYTQQTKLCPGDSTLLYIPASVSGDSTLNTTFAGGNYERGNMFQVKSKTCLTITGFDANTSATTNFSIYYKKGSFVGFERDSTKWTLLGRVDNVPSNGANKPTPVPISFKLDVPADSTVSFYLTSTTRQVIYYTNGSTQGNLYAQNSDLQFFEGVGLDWPFSGKSNGSIFSPRIFNGIIHYETIKSTIKWFDNSTNDSVWVKPLTTSSFWAERTQVGTTNIGYDTIEIEIQNLTVPVPNDTFYCQGGDVVIDAGQAPVGTKFSWDPSAVVAGQYILYDSPGKKWMKLTSTLGCFAFDSFDVTEIKNPKPYLGNDTAFCEGQKLKLDAGVYPSGTKYSWSNGDTSQTLTVDSSAKYSVLVDNRGCKGSDEILVTVKQNPKVALGTDVEICDSDSATFDAGADGTIYQWTGGGTLQTETYYSSGEYIATVTNSVGCSTVDTVNLIVNSLPIVNLGPDKNVCSGSPDTLDAGDFGTGTVYSWNNSLSSQKIIIDKSGTYSVEVTDPKGCKGIDEFLYTVRPTPIVNIGDSIDFCKGNSILLDAGNQTSGSKYFWSNSDTSKSITVSTGGNYSLTVTNADNCSDSDMVSVYERELPIVDLGTDLEVCNGDSVMLDAGLHDSYLWSNTKTSRIVYVKNGTFSVSVTTVYGCKGNDDITISRAAEAFANFTGVNQGVGRIQFNDFSSNADTYEWDFGDGNTSTDDSPKHQYTTAGEKTVKLTVTNKCGSHSTTKTITVNPLSIGQLPLDGLFSVYPNPNNGAFAIEINKSFDQVNLEVRSVTGQIIMNQDLGKTTIDAHYNIQLPENVQSGAYLIRITADGQLATMLVTIQ